jgi:tripartite-type tricarboxylate transporter receptor subunit TctC
LVAAAVIGHAVAAHAQTDFPTKPITIVVPFGAGGPSDVVTRVLADELAKVWKQQVIVSNKPGGGTIIGISTVAKAAPDGHTWAMISGAFTVNPAVRSTMPYDALKDFVGVSIFIDAPHAIVAHPGFKPSTLPEMIEEANKRGEGSYLTYATSGLASSSHMTGELLRGVAGTKFRHVPYAGGAVAALPDILTGRVDFSVSTWADVRPYVESGKMKLIAISYRNRLPEAPQAAMLSETYPALASLPIGAWNGIVVPAAVPPAIVEKISAGIQAATSSETFKKRILDLGSYPRFTTIKDTEKFLTTEIETWKKIAKEANIKLE